MPARTTVARTLAALLVLIAVAACGTSGGSVSASLSSVSGDVTGYPYAGTSTVQAFAPNDGAQLVSGRVYPDPGARVEGTLTATGSIPASSFVNPYFCSGATVTPTDVQTTGVFLLGVADSGGVFGALARATVPPFASNVAVGDRLYFYFASTRAGRVSGSCATSGASYVYDIDLVQGWNHVSARVDATDSFGTAIAFTYRNEAPGSDATWLYTDLSDLAATSEEDATPTSLIDAARLGLPGL